MEEAGGGRRRPEERPDVTNAKGDGEAPAS